MNFIRHNSKFEQAHAKLMIEAQVNIAKMTSEEFAGWLGSMLYASPDPKHSSTNHDLKLFYDEVFNELLVQLKDDISLQGFKRTASLNFADEVRYVGFVPVFVSIPSVNGNHFLDDMAPVFEVVCDHNGSKHIAFRFVVRKDGDFKFSNVDIEWVLGTEEGKKAEKAATIKRKKMGVK